MEEILASIRRILNEDEPADGPGGQPSEEAPPDDDVLVLDRSMLISAPDADPGSPEAERPAATQPAALAVDVAEADGAGADRAESGPEEADPAAHQMEAERVATAGVEVERAEADEVGADEVGADRAAAGHLANEPVDAHLEAIAESVTSSEFPAASEFQPVTSGEPPVGPASDAARLSDQALVGAAAAAATASSVDDLMRALAASKAARVFHGGPTIEDLVREELRLLLKGWLEDNLPQLVERLVRAEIEKLVGRSVA
jgi:cell pole-organizing protein PopZ